MFGRRLVMSERRLVMFGRRLVMFERRLVMLRRRLGHVWKSFFGHLLRVNVWSSLFGETCGHVWGDVWSCLGDVW